MPYVCQYLHFYVIFCFLPLAMTQLFIFYSHDTILKNKVTFCDTPKDNTPPKASEQSVEQTITYSEILILDSPPAGHKNIKRTPR